ncbi:MAG: universal stress protein [Segniliparus sp.]|uniref:universal stress protein n=1 Tax=Segniliparus sp. TaxID=2804064 RepID=UPI003F3BB02A
MSYSNSPSVVVGFDGSESSAQAARWAAQIALRENIPCVLLHAVSMPHFGAAGVLFDGDFVWAIEEEGKQLVEEFGEQLAAECPGLPLEVEVRTGSPVGALVDASERARMVVLGSTGKTAFTGMLVGSTAVAVAHRARCPVAVVRGHAEPSQSPGGPVVVGVDGSKASDLAVAVAFEEASWRGAELLAVHAWMESLSDSGGVYAYPLLIDWESIEVKERVLLSEQLAGWREKYPDVQVRTEITRDRPNHALLERAASAQMLVVGSRGHSELVATVLGSTAQAMIYHAPCPVVIAHER